jgi:hypothetical protein
MLLYQKLVRKFCFYTWRFWELLGIHIIPNHFYFPILDSRKLKNYNFKKEFSCEGIVFHEAPMLDLLEEIKSHSSEYAPLHKNVGYSSNGDGAILYGMIRHLKPNKIIEVGSGFSTELVSAANKMNILDKQFSPQITCIEPYPKPILRKLSTEGDVNLIEDKVEEIPLSVFNDLDSGDILFIDSSHVVDIGNDVHHLYLNILPSIPVGVYVHIHDIRLPFEYPQSWVLEGHKHWTEQYLLHMFLAFNQSFEVIFASNYMFNKQKEKMISALPGLDESGWPGAFWIRRIK